MTSYLGETFILTLGVPEVCVIFVMADHGSDAGEFESLVRQLWSVSVVLVRRMCLKCRTAFF